MGYFAGLDVSLEETAICIVDDAGRIVREARVASEPEALVAFFAACGMRMARIGLEACSLTAWLHQGLSAAGLPAICIEARQAKRPSRPDATPLPVRGDRRAGPDQPVRRRAGPHRAV